MLPAEMKAATTAFAALTAMPAKAADADALADLPDGRNLRAARDDPPDDLVSRNPALRRIGLLDVAAVGAADAASLDRDENLARLGHGYEPFDKLKPARLRHLDGSVGCRNDIPSRAIRDFSERHPGCHQTRDRLVHGST